MGQLAIAVRWGAPTESQVTMVLASVSNAAASVTVGDGASADPVSWSQVGTSGVYTASVDITSLKPFPFKTAYTVTQGGNSVSAFVRPKPGRKTDCEMIFNTCDANSTTGGDDEDGWENIKAYAQANANLYGLVFADDTGYPDRLVADDAGFTGLSTGGEPEDVRTVDSYAVAYACHLGLLGNAAYVSPTGSNTIARGHQEARQWCYQNLCFLPQYGDHEFTDNFGYGAGGVHRGDLGAGDDIWNAARPVYDAFLLPLQGTSAQELAGVGTGDANANHWYIDIGPARFVVPDPVYNADNQDTTLHGIPQIKDLLTALDCDQPFKLFANGSGDRYTATDGSGAFGRGSNRFFAQSDPAVYNTPAGDEYGDFYSATGNTEQSVMENPKTNGAGGIFVNLSGDEHVSYVARSYYSGGTLPHEFYVCRPGTVNGSFNFNPPSNADEAKVNTGTPASRAADRAAFEVEYPYVDPTWDHDAQGTKEWGAVLLKFHAARYPDVMEIQMRNENFDIAWRRYFAWQVTDNLGSATMPVYAGGIGMGGDE